jgi:hypothetical protein
MTPSESWVKNLRCPLCDREGQALLSHLDDPKSEYGFRTIVEECPKGFRVQEDEDDSYIVRFFCVTDNIAADQ